MTETPDRTSAFVLDMLEDAPPEAVSRVLEEVRAMRLAVKTHMDTGLAPESMKKARALEAGILAAEDVVRRLFP